MTIKCIAIDDESFALEAIKQHCLAIPCLDLVGLFSDPTDAICHIENNSVDLIFLDIHMPELSGIDFIKSLRLKPHIIFTSAYSQYAINGYDLNVVDFILKPFDFGRFNLAVEKVKEKMNYLEIVENYGRNNEYITVRVEYRKVKVYLNDICYLEGLDNYSKIHTSSKYILTLQNLKNISKLLPENKFIRVHKSFIVSRTRIESYAYNKIRINGKNIPIGRSFSKNFLYSIESKTNFSIP
jgi:DNA-binding LytR/AlgR family response regulator